MRPRPVPRSRLWLWLPLVQKFGYGGRVHFAHGLEFAVLLAVEHVAARVENSESGYAFLQRNLIFLGNVSIAVVAADVDVDQDEVVVQQVEVGLLVEVDVEHLAVSAPVTAEVEDDALVFVFRGDERLRDVVICVGCIGIDGAGLRACSEGGENEYRGGNAGTSSIHDADLPGSKLGHRMPQVGISILISLSGQASPPIGLFVFKRLGGGDHPPASG